MNSYEFELEQYRALRGEILRAMEDGNQVMSLGLAAIALLLGAALSARDSDAAYLVLALFVPALSGLVLSMWFAAQERIARASFFLTGVETRVCAALGTEHPCWENWLRRPNPAGEPTHHFWNTEYSGIAIFMFFMVGPLLLSTSPTVGGTISLRVKLFAAAVGLVVLVLYFMALLPRLHRWRAWLSSTFAP
jgi:hypothetical protein